MNADRMVYIDSSSLLKTLWNEPERSAVRAAISVEDRVVISALAELETEVQLRAKWPAGVVSRNRYEQYRGALSSFQTMAPFEFREIPGTVFRQTIQQHVSGPKRHCRSLDRLHLAAMGELGLRRLMTTDTKQATAARLLGYEVVFPDH